MSKAKSHYAYAPRMLVVCFGCGLIGTASAARAQEQTQLEGYHGADGRIYTGDGDWYGPNKTAAECGGDYEIMKGVAINTDSSWGHGVLCATPPLKYQPGEPRRADAPPNMEVYYDAGRTVAAFSPIDRENSGDNVWWPTDRATAVMECADDEVMTAIAQGRSPDYQETTTIVRCSKTNKVATDCRVLLFKDNDASEDSVGDWAPGYLKGTCGEGRYVKSLVSYTTYSEDFWGDRGGFYVPGAILCCSPADLPTTTTFP